MCADSPSPHLRRAFRTAAPNDPAPLLGQVWVESKPGEWQRCIAFAGQLPAGAGADIKRQTDEMRREAVGKLQELVQRLNTRD